MATAVTAYLPAPMKLKFEKVYLPCILETKKRYVGFAYETPAQAQPAFDAKGIETVRRDGCPAVAKMLERTLRLLFTTRDLSRVKLYTQTQVLPLGGVGGASSPHAPLLVAAHSRKPRQSLRVSLCKGTFA
jgi:DNA polymerase zeta